MTKGFLNLNRFKYGRAIKQSSKRKADLRSGKRIRRRAFNRHPER